MPSYRVGQGFDVHIFAMGRPLVLGGVTIPYVKGLHGHSDADALTHAICDAILGAAGLRDIGYHFPDTDEQYKGIDSFNLLKRVLELAKEKGFVVENVDATVVAERPKLLLHIEEMQDRLHEVLSSTGGPGDVNVKATTSEGVGFVGRGEGIAVQAIVLLSKE